MADWDTVFEGPQNDEDLWREPMVMRFPVPGGWLYRVIGKASAQLVFVPYSENIGEEGR